MAPVSTLSFKCALITGGGGGLGKAMAEDLIKQGKKVLIAGRTESKLKETTTQIGATGYYVLDTGDIPSIASFISKLVKEHPDVDCIINNAGVQRPLQILGPDYDFDLSKADEEIDINIRGPLHLTVAIIKYWAEHSIGGVLMNVSSQLGYIPFALSNPVYNGTKSWTHAFTVNIRDQLAKVDSPIKVVEIVPPMVESDLHRDKKNPDDNKKSNAKAAMTVEEFMADVKEGWEKNEDTIGAGAAKEAIKLWYGAFGDKYKKMMK